MVSNVGKLTQSVREGFKKRTPDTHGSSTVLAEKRAVVHRELNQTGEAIFVDDKGNRFHIERRPA